MYRPHVGSSRAASPKLVRKRRVVTSDYQKWKCCLLAERPYPPSPPLHEHSCRSVVVGLSQLESDSNSLHREDGKVASVGLGDAAVAETVSERWLAIDALGGPEASDTWIATEFM